MKLTVYSVLVAMVFATADALAGSTTVFENVSPEGVPEFSDRASPGAISEQIGTPNLMKPVEVVTPPKVPPDSTTEVSHVSISVKKPVAQQNIWSGSGDIEVKFSANVTPLSTQYQVLLDSQMLETTTQETTVLHNIPRGEHRLQVKAINSAGGGDRSVAGSCFLCPPAHRQKSGNKISPECKIAAEPGCYIACFDLLTETKRALDGWIRRKLHCACGVSGNGPTHASNLMKQGLIEERAFRSAFNQRGRGGTVVQVA